MTMYGYFSTMSTNPSLCKESDQMSARDTLNQLIAGANELIAALDAADVSAAKIAELNANVAALQNQAITLQAQNVRLNDQVSTLNASVATRDNTIATLQALIVQLQARIKELETGEPPVEPPPPVPSSSKPKVPATGVYLGASFDTRSGESKAQARARTETHSGRKLAITHYYLTGDEWSADFDEDVKAGRMPHISTKPASWDAVANGSADAMIKTFAAKIKALNGPVFVTYWHEPTNDTGSAATYIKAWQRFRKVMDDAGVKNAAYVWVMIAYDLRTAFDADSYYPGDTVVDWIGADPYNWYPNRPGSTWAELSKVCQHAVAYAKKKSKPLFLAEWGTNEDPAVAGRKGAWFKNALAFFKAEPTIKAVVYFNNTHTNTSGTPFVNHWEVDSSSTALAEWKKLGTDPYMTPTTFK
jgi:hypothetical protein